MAFGPSLSRELQAFVAVIAAGAAVVLLADLIVLWVLAIGWLRGKSLLARRWSAVHVLVAFQVWMLITLVFAVMATLALTLTALGGAGSAHARGAALIVVITLIVQNLAMVGVVLFFVLVVYDQHPIAAGLSLRNWAPKVTVGLLAAALLIPLNPALEHLSLLAVRHSSFSILLQKAFQEQLNQLTSLFKGPGGLALGIVLTGLVAPFGEELFFRGFAYRCFRARWGRVAAMLGSAACFALIHVNLAGFASIFVLGCALAYLYERTGTLVAPFTLHAANNVVAILALYFQHGR